MLHGTTITRNVVDLLDLPPLELQWFVSTDIDREGGVEMPLRVARETPAHTIGNWAIALIQHVWNQIYKFEDETRAGGNEAIDDLQPMMKGMTGEQHYD